VVYQDDLEGTVHVSGAVAFTATPEDLTTIWMFKSVLVDKIIQQWRVWKNVRDLHGNLPGHAYNKPIIDTMVYRLGLEWNSC